MLILLGILVGILIMFQLAKVYRQGSIIIIDFDEALVEMEALYERAQVYAQNRQGGQPEEYIAKYIKDQAIKPDGILKAQEIQSLGYCLVFSSRRPEYLRPETAIILNNWGLSGALYMGLPSPGLLIDHMHNMNRRVVGVYSGGPKIEFIKK